MKKVASLFIAVVFLIINTAHGVSAQKWELRRLEQFLKGDFKNISVSFEGVLSLAPREKKLESPSEEFFLSLLLAPDETMFLGTGHAGKIYKVSKSGDIELYFQVPEMDIYCLIRDAQGNIFAGTSPNGKIYKITEKGKGEVFFDPKEKYIWDLMFTGEGSLLAAVGETGGIYEITSQGQGIKFLEVKENHILCMKRAVNGDLIAGSGGKGRLYRLSANKKVSIQYESSYEEIRNIALDGKGNIYVAAGGTVIKPKLTESSVSTVKSTADVTVTANSSGTVVLSSAASGKEQPGALLRVNSEGIAKKLWSSKEEFVYSLVWNKDNKNVIFGTGNRGRVFSIDENDKLSLLVQKDSEQIYHLSLRGSNIYVLTNNSAGLFILHEEQSYSGEYISRVFDANILSSWGRVAWEPEVPTGTILRVQTRSGNSDEPSQTWSDWSPLYKEASGEQILNPAARYLQFKIIFKTDSGKVSPKLKKIMLFYQQTNIAPEINLFKVLPPNIVFLEPAGQNDKIWGFEPGAKQKAVSQDNLKSMVVAKKKERKGYRTVVWSGEDENGDILIYSLYIRNQSESKWRLLKDKWAEKIFVFETLSFPDGEYFLKIEANDSPSNPLGREAKSEKISRAFVIDNSLPVIRNFQAKRSGSVLKLSFSADDGFSQIKEVKFLIRPDEWHSIVPEDGICDSNQEKFDLRITLPENFDNMITVKVIDEQGNIGVHLAAY